MVGTPANAINATGASGLCNFDGTATFSTTSLTQYNILSGATSKTVNNIAPTSTLGIPLVSKGTSAQPAFDVASIAGGGTNASSFTQTNGVVVYNGTRLVNYTGPQISSSGVATNTTQPSFLAYLSTTQNNVTGDGTDYLVICDTVVFDRASNYNNSTGNFTAPVTGIYCFTANFTIVNIAIANNLGDMRIVPTIGAFIGTRGNFFNIADTAGTLQAQATCITPMTAGDTCNSQFNVKNGTKTVGIFGQSLGVGAFTTSFSGFLIC